ncbi:hypothetical protein TRFO_25463 [Tritrichomonas foetus]|uniref:Uncharacterized protein n=1 Tax=Tritrichomonas foetus TaxID=1144522 RepID=A0A1J4KAM9_9EUKA|nr:hypothetical protein TRFO_25463 [Tritrichomonas foetus]|eukprot:OHT06509.1 hypothetical protein TRFO_25463 [Tritrichomonas foetus]
MNLNYKSDGAHFNRGIEEISRRENDQKSNEYENNNKMIDHDFSQKCINSMLADVSILNDLKSIYSENVPFLDHNFIHCFIDYFNHESQDSFEIYDFLVEKNASIFIQLGIMKNLIQKIPNSLYLICRTLEFGKKEAFSSFSNECGFYIITQLSNNDRFQLLISHILKFTIKYIRNYTDYLEPPFSFDDLMCGGSGDFPDLTLNNLVRNLLKSNNEEVLNTTLSALQIGFENHVEACVILGIPFMEKFDYFLSNNNLITNAVYAFSAGCKSFPFVDDRKMNGYTENLLLSNDTVQMDIGLVLFISLLRKTEIFDINQSHFQKCFNGTNLIKIIFNLAENGPYKIKVRAFETIDQTILIINKLDLKVLIDHGLLDLINDLFGDEPPDSFPDEEIILVSLNILEHIMPRILSQESSKELYQQLRSYFLYLKQLQYHINDNISQQARIAFASLLPFFIDTEDDQ